MNKFLTPLLCGFLLLLSGCGVSGEQKEKATADFNSKVSALYLRLGVPAVFNSASLDEFEEGGLNGVGAFHASFFLNLDTDDGLVKVSGRAAFNEDGSLAWASDSTLAIQPLVIVTPQDGIHASLDSPYLIKEFSK